MQAISSAKSGLSVRDRYGVNPILTAWLGNGLPRRRVTPEVLATHGSKCARSAGYDAAGDDRNGLLGQATCALGNKHRFANEIPKSHEMPECDAYTKPDESSPPRLITLLGITRLCRVLGDAARQPSARCALHRRRQRRVDGMDRFRMHFRTTAKRRPVESPCRLLNLCTWRSDYPMVFAVHPRFPPAE